jgi:hypothetical protein
MTKPSAPSNQPLFIAPAGQGPAAPAAAAQPRAAPAAPLLPHAPQGRRPPAFIAPVDRQPRARGQNRPGIGLENFLAPRLKAITGVEPEARQNISDGMKERAFARAMREISELNTKSTDVKSRGFPPLSVALRPHKPSTDQYQYAKGLNAQQRAEVSAALEDLITGVRQAPGVPPERALTIWKSVKHAQLLTHTDEQRKTYRNAQQANFILAPTVVFAPFAFRKLKAGHREYYRSAARPEYAAAFNGMMAMLRSSVATRAHKRDIARTLLFQYIGEENLITPADRNAIIHAIDPHQQILAGHTTLKVPTGGAGDENKLLDKIIAFADRGPAAPRAPGRRGDRDRLSAAERNEIARAGDLSKNIEKIFELANVAQRQAWDEDNARRLMAGERPLAPFKQKELPAVNYNKEPNAQAFSAVLQRLTNPPATMRLHAEAEAQLTPEVRKALALNAVTIVEAMANPELRAQIFKESVGAPRSCNNNTLEIFNRLTKLARSAVVLDQIRSGQMSPAAAASMGVRFARLAELEYYLYGPFANTARGKEARRRGVMPEVALATKSAAKGVLQLPGVTKVDVPEKLWKTNAKETQAAIDHVERIEADSARHLRSTRSPLNKNPDWRKIIIALAEKYKPQDAQLMRVFTHHGEYELQSPRTGQTRVINIKTKKEVQHASEAVKALRALDELAVLDIEVVPPEEYASLYNELATCLTQVEEQLAAHYAQHLLERNSTGVTRGSAGKQFGFQPGFTENPPGTLPKDGEFQPVFTLPQNWEARIATLKARASAGASEASAAAIADIEEEEDEDADRRSAHDLAAGPVRELRTPPPIDETESAHYGDFIRYMEGRFYPGIDVFKFNPDATNISKEVESMLYGPLHGTAAPAGTAHAIGTVVEPTPRAPVAGSVQAAMGAASTEDEMARTNRLKPLVEDNLATKGIAIVRNGGGDSAIDCLIIALVMHATGDYGWTSRQRDEAVAELRANIPNRNQLYPDDQIAAELIAHMNARYGVSLDLHYLRPAEGGTVASFNVLGTDGEKLGTDPVYVLQSGQHFEALVDTKHVFPE